MGDFDKDIKHEAILPNCQIFCHNYWFSSQFISIMVMNMSFQNLVEWYSLIVLSAPLFATILFLVDCRAKTLSSPLFLRNGLKRDFVALPDTKLKGFVRMSALMKSANGLGLTSVVSSQSSGTCSMFPSLSNLVTYVTSGASSEVFMVELNGVS